MSGGVVVWKQYVENVTEEVLREVNRRLEELRGYIRLAPDPLHLARVVPIWLPAPPQSYHHPLNALNLHAPTLQLWSDCLRVSAACLGSEVVPESTWFREHWQTMAERALVRNPLSNGYELVEAVESGFADNLAEKFCYSVLSKYQLLLKEKLEISNQVQIAKKAQTNNMNSDSGVNPSNLLGAISRLKKTTTVVHEGGCVDGKSTVKPRTTTETTQPTSSDLQQDSTPPKDGDLWELYGKAYLSKTANLSDLAKELEINQWIRPTVGDTLVIVPALKASTWSRWVIKDGYNPNFHWAPVVLVTEDGYVCLENFAVADPTEINTKWEFRYYKYEQGGYHQKLMEGGGYGNIAITLRLTIPQTSNKFY